MDFACLGPSSSAASCDTDYRHLGFAKFIFNFLPLNGIDCIDHHSARVGEVLIGDDVLHHISSRFSIGAMDFAGLLALITSMRPLRVNSSSTADCFASSAPIVIIVSRPLVGGRELDTITWQIAVVHTDISIPIVGSRVAAARSSRLVRRRRHCRLRSQSR